VAADDLRLDKTLLAFEATAELVFSFFTGFPLAFDLSITFVGADAATLFVAADVLRLDKILLDFEATVVLVFSFFAI
jgi:hypothetical protein